MKWRPAKAIAKLCREVAKRAASQVRGAAPRVQHRDGTDARANAGRETLARAIESTRFVVEKAWGAVMNWSGLGQSARHFREGNVRQKPRPFDLAPTVERVRSVVKADALAHFQKRAQKLEREVA